MRIAVPFRDPALIWGAFAEDVDDDIVVTITADRRAEGAPDLAAVLAIEDDLDIVLAPTSRSS